MSPSQPPDLQLFTDASGSLGYGGFLDGQWFQGGQKDFLTFNLMHGLVGPSNLLLPASEQACCCMEFVE